MLRQLLHGMLRIRTVEETIAELYAEQEMRCPVHLCSGQEAVAAGVCAALQNDDYAMGAHRSHGHYLAKGGDLKAMLAEIYGKATGCCGGMGGSMHLVDLNAGFLGATPIVGSTIPIAVGAAFGSVMRGEQRVTAVFFGDGATEEGVFHEAVNFAALKKLPVIFVCENNRYSVYSSLEVRQPEREIVDLARGHGLPAVQGDGNDAAAVYELTLEAAKRARRGEGPTFLELATYRWREHCGPNYDDELGYRPEGELERWQALDPIPRLEQRLLAGEAISPEEVDRWRTELQTEVREAVAFAKASPVPDASGLAERVYAA